MSLPFVPGIAERMEELGYDQLLRAYEDKYGKKYPPYRMEVHKEGGLAYMEELRAQFPGEDIDDLIKHTPTPGRENSVTRWSSWMSCAPAKPTRSRFKRRENGHKMPIKR